MKPENEVLRQYASVHTDLALEAHAAALKTDWDQQGVEVENKTFPGGNVSRVHVLDARGAAQLGKPPGTYITIEAPGLREHDVELREQVGQVLAQELASLLPQNATGATLVVGLGNWHVTPDSLGPLVVEELLVTRHLFEYAPDYVDEGMRSVCAIAPGVLGITGIETGDIIQGIVQKVQPSAIIAIDALAARSIDRLGTTIQISDTGISPGSGVGNKRHALNQETLGIPVIAIGAPSVVYANTIVLDAIQKLTESLRQNASPQSNVGGILRDLSPEEQGQLVHEVLSPFWGNLVVAPKETDEQIRQMSKVIAGGLNVALQPGLETSDTLRYLQ
ncbi:MAG TPA: GPR endopeptidase [Firmicutes bacterium]|nr:GPR endopeptidase [Bacillota bacterium]